MSIYPANGFKSIGATAIYKKRQKCVFYVFIFTEPLFMLALCPVSPCIPLFLFSYGDALESRKRQAQYFETITDASIAYLRR